MRKETILLNLNEIEQQQVQKVQTFISQCLLDNLLAVYLYGSAVEDGLQPYSDIDFFLLIKQKVYNGCY